jgi:hypothetical protein
MRYVTTERRGMSRKDPRPEGWRRHEPIGGVAPRSRRAQAMLPPRVRQRPDHWAPGVSTAL